MTRWTRRTRQDRYQEGLPRMHRDEKRCRSVGMFNKVHELSSGVVRVCQRRASKLTLISSFSFPNTVALIRVLPRALSELPFSRCIHVIALIILPTQHLYKETKAPLTIWIPCPFGATAIAAATSTLLSYPMAPHELYPVLNTPQQDG